MPILNYKLSFADSARQDQKMLKSYILREFKYKEYGKSFDTKMITVLRVLKEGREWMKIIKKWIGAPLK